MQSRSIGSKEAKTKTSQFKFFVQGKTHKLIY